MKRVTKVWLAIAGSLVLIGCILFAVVLSVLNWDFTKLSTVRFQTSTYEIDEAFSDISLTSEAADIVFALSDDGKCRVECYEEENAKHSVAVEDGMLVVRTNKQKDWYDYIGLSFVSPKITVYLPKTEYRVLSIHESSGNIAIPNNYSFARADISLSAGDVAFSASVSKAVEIGTGTGNICVENNSVGSLELSVTTGETNVSGVSCDGSITVAASTGKAYLTNIACGSVISSGNTGSITLSNVIASEKLSIDRGTGDVKFIKCDAAEIYVKANTGSVTGSLLSNKVFITETNTGSVDVPDTEEGGGCKIITNTGDIRITIGN